MYCAKVQAFISTSNTYIQRRQTNRFKESALSKQQSETSILTLSPARFLHIDLKPHNGHRKPTALKPIFQVPRSQSVYPPRAKINYQSLNNLSLHLIPLHYATNRQVAGSIPDGVIVTQSCRSHYGPGVDSASNRHQYQVSFLGVKAAGACKADNLATILCCYHEIWEP